VVLLPLLLLLSPDLTHLCASAPMSTVLTEDRAVAAAVEQDAAVASTSGAAPAPVYKTIKQLRLRSAAAYLPHPDKESYGGEDAHFVSNVSGGAIGVADGKWYGDSLLRMVAPCC
jgi:hypothetical protein